MNSLLIYHVIPENVYYINLPSEYVNEHKESLEMAQNKYTNCSEECNNGMEFLSDELINGIYDKFKIDISKPITTQFETIYITGFCL